MALARYDIVRGQHYWVRPKAGGDPVITKVYDSGMGPQWVVSACFIGAKDHTKFDVVFEKFDFIARIEPPEGV
jgi:hypothetical protein